jgi:uncharacterized Zn finger protein (UPF0148 family)
MKASKQPKPKTLLRYVCPKHKTPLVYVLKGGAGYCRGCGLYVQADGIPMPTLDRLRKPRTPVRKTTKRKSKKVKSYA